MSDLSVFSDLSVLSVLLSWFSCLSWWLWQPWWKGGLYQDGGAWGRKEERGFRNKAFNFHSSSSGVEKVKVKVLSDHWSSWSFSGIFVSAWNGQEGESTRKINKSWDFQPFIAIEDNKQTSYPYLIFVIFLTRAKFLENKIYTEKTRKLRQNTHKIANFLR